MNREEVRQLSNREIKKTESLINDYEEMSQPVESDNAIGCISRMDVINNQSVTIHLNPDHGPLIVKYDTTSSKGMKFLEHLSLK